MKHQRRRSGMRKVARRSFRTRRSMFFGAINTVKVVVYVSHSDPGQNQFPVKVPYINQTNHSIPIFENETVRSVVAKITGRPAGASNLMAGPSGGGIYLTASIENFQAASSYPDPSRDYTLSTPVKALTDMIAIWFKASPVDLDRHMQNIQNQKGTPDNVQRKIMAYQSAASDEATAARNQVLARIESQIQCVRDRHAEFARNMASFTDTLEEIRKQPGTQGTQIGALERDANELRELDIVGDLNTLLLSLDRNASVADLTKNLSDLESLCRRAQGDVDESAELIYKVRDLNVKLKFMAEIDEKIKCVQTALTSVDTLAERFQLTAEAIARLENPSSDEKYEPIMQKAQGLTDEMIRIREETNAIQKEVKDGTIVDLSEPLNKLNGLCDHIREKELAFTTSVSELNEVLERTKARIRARTEKVKDLSQKWFACHSKATTEATGIVEKYRMDLDAEETKEDAPDAMLLQLEEQIRRMKSLIRNVYEHIRTNSDENYVNAQCVEMNVLLDRIKQMNPSPLARRGPARALRREPNVYDMINTEYMKSGISHYIREGVANMELPSEYAQFQNKHEWVQALKTSEGRRKLFESLSGLTNYLSGLLGQLRTKNPLVVIEPAVEGADAHVVSAETYRQFESFFAWHVLDEIMSTVRFQVSLSFGHERPAKPRNVLENVGFNKSGDLVHAYLRVLVAKVFIVLAVSCALFSYVYEPGASSSAALDGFVKDMESTGQATFHEVTFFRGSQHIPLVTFYNPENAEQYESFGGVHWVEFVANQGITNIEMEVHKFITPRLTGAFMDFFGGFEGAVWTRDASHDAFHVAHAAHAAHAAPGGYNDDD